MYINLEEDEYKVMYEEEYKQSSQRYYSIINEGTAGMNVDEEI